MRKVSGLFFFILCIGLLFGACNKDDSYADYVKKEKNRIKDFISEHDIVVLNDYPTGRAFKKNEYFLDPSGVYIHVVDSGNGKRAKSRADVYYRFSGAMSLPTADSDTINLSEISAQPLSFIYGLTSSYTNSTQGSIGYFYLSPRIVSPLQYVGEGAVVRLIIPFKDYLGSSAQNSGYITYYMDKVEYGTISNPE